MDRKINIGFVSPYQAMEPLLEELQSLNSDLEISVKTGNLKTGVLYAKEMEKEGADVIISRGGTAQMIREFVRLPVVDIHISGYDLLRSITLASSQPEEKVALVGFSNITLGAASIVSLLDLNLKVVTIYKADEVEKTLLALKREGFTRILGDVVTMDVSTKLGLHGMLIHSGRESVSESLEEARRLYKTLSKSQKLLRAAQSLFKKMEKDFLVIDGNGQVLFETWISFDGNPLSLEELNGLRLQVLNGGPLAKIITGKRGAVSIKAELLKDREGDNVAFFFNYLSTEIQEMKNIKIEEIVQVPPFITESPVMKEIRAKIESPAGKTAPIYLVGEIGTGKKTIVRYLHAYHKKTGFMVSGEFKEVNNSIEAVLALPISTLLLELSPPIDKDSLHSLEHLAETVGSHQIQLILTSRSAIQELKDSYAFKDAVIITIPNLKSRSQDIEAITRQHLAEFHQELGTHPVKIQTDAMGEIIETANNGNLISLKSYIKKLALFEKGYVIDKRTLQQIPSTEDFKEEGILRFSAEDTLKEIEQKLIEQILLEEQFNQTKAAKRLGINRATLWRKLKQ